MLDLLSESTESTGYLLKDRIADIGTFTDSVRRVAARGSALDPEVVSLLLGRWRQEDPLEVLTPGERAPYRREAAALVARFAPGSRPSTRRGAARTMRWRGTTARGRAL